MKKEQHLNMLFLFALCIHQMLSIIMQINECLKYCIELDINGNISNGYSLILTTSILCLGSGHIGIKESWLISKISGDSNFMELTSYA